MTDLCEMCRGTAFAADNAKPCWHCGGTGRDLSPEAVARHWAQVAGVNSPEQLQEILAAQAATIRGLESRLNDALAEAQRRALVEEAAGIDADRANIYREKMQTAKSECRALEARALVAEGKVAKVYGILTPRCGAGCTDSFCRLESRIYAILDATPAPPVLCENCGNDDRIHCPV